VRCISSISFANRREIDDSENRDRSSLALNAAAESVSRTQHFRVRAGAIFRYSVRTFIERCARVLLAERFTGVSLIFYLRVAHKRSDIRRRDVSVYFASAASSASLLWAVCATRNLDKFRGPEVVADSFGERAFALLPSRPSRDKARVVISQNRPFLVIKSLVDGYAEPGIIRIIISALLDRAIAVYFVDGRQCHAPASGTIARSLARVRAANNLTVTAFDAPRCFIKFRVLNGRRAGNYARDLSFHSAVRANSPQSRVHSAAERGRPSIEKFMTEIEPVRLSRFREPSRSANFRRDFTLIRVLFLSSPVLPEEVVSDVSRSSTTRSVIYSRVAPETIKARREGRRCAGSVGR